ncbi:MAG: hypothetical protein PVI71_08450, partial [Desulfobacterales bacterium]
FKVWGLALCAWGFALWALSFVKTFSYAEASVFAKASPDMSGNMSPDKSTHQAGFQGQRKD